MDLPLQGLKVVEVAGGIPAAYCTHMLAGYGAEVVRVEDADTPTWTLSEDEATYLLPAKRRLSLHPGAAPTASATTPPANATPAATAVLARLVAAADVVVVDGRPGRFDVAAWRQANPALVAVTIAPFGQSGPDRDQPADDLIAFAAGGTLSLTGDPAAEPLVTGGAQAMQFGGLHAFSAALATYYGAVVHGEGGWVDISLQECLAGALELYGPAAAHGEPAALRFGNYHRAVWAVYPCADGYAGVFCLERQVPALFALIGEPVLQEERFRDPLQRPAHDEELAAYVLSFMIEHTGDELLRLGGEHRIPFGKVRTPSELLASPALRERGFFDVVTRSDGSEVRVPGRPFLAFDWCGGGAVAPQEQADALISAWER